ncbi:MAG: metallohydrolase [Saprospiraceae bacterium]
MANKLLIRLYNVGLGDCIYVRIPAESPAKPDFHILIDCGTLGETQLVSKAIKDLETNMLPLNENSGKRRLDLLVATHPHKDHIIGFDPGTFAKIEIANIWLSPIMNPNHGQNKNIRQLQSNTMEAIKSIRARGLALGQEFELLASLFGLDRKGAELALTKTIPEKNNIEPKYVHAGNNSDELGLNLPAQTKITVVGPENNIDYYYLGEEAAADFQGLSGFAQTFAQKQNRKKNPSPRNISAHDFQILQSRMLSDAFAFANLSSEVENNSSLVLLIEWRNKRLLFVGDAEWDEKFREGKHNAAWNVMWNKRKDLLNKPLDFLKIGHHGSVNATPFLADEPASHEVNQILNAILPLPAAGKKPKAQAVASTLRGRYDVIPDTNLLIELGKRVKDQRVYKNAFAKISNFDFDAIPLYAEKEKANLDKKQPYRTDFEKLLQKGEFVDITIK